MAKQIEDTKTINIPFFRTPYNYDTNAASDESATTCKDPSMAQQSSKEETDINTIVERFGLTGELPSGVRAPQYGDFTAVTDYHTALNAVAIANEAFDEMPWKIRARFHNDPENFVKFVADPANRDEAIKLGLIIPKPAEPIPSAMEGTTATVLPGQGTPRAQGGTSPKPQETPTNATGSGTPGQ